MTLPLLLILTILVFCSYLLAKIRYWVVGLLGSILLWLLLVGITISIYPRMDYITTSILIGGIGILVWIAAKHKPIPVQERKMQQWIYKEGEASTEFELYMLPTFLQRVIPLVESGFSNLQVELLQQSAATLAVDEEADFKFQVQYQGHIIPFHVKIFIDDIECATLYFFTAKELAEKIGREMDSCMEMAESLFPDYSDD
jgi:hypothetical protein